MSSKVNKSSNIEDNFFRNPKQRELYRAVYIAATSSSGIGIFDPGEYRPAEAKKMFDLLNELSLDEIQEVFEKVFEKSGRDYNIGLNGIEAILHEKIKKINQIHKEARNSYVNNNKKGGKKYKKNRKSRKSKKNSKTRKSRKYRK